MFNSINNNGNSSCTSQQLPLKLVDVYFTKNLDQLGQQYPPLKKCQIPLLVDDCPTIILQINQHQLLLNQNQIHHNNDNFLNNNQSVFNHRSSQTQKTDSLKPHGTSNINLKNTCNLCNANKKEYETFLNKYKTCSSENKTNYLINECDADDNNNNNDYEEENVQNEDDECKCDSCLQKDQEFKEKPTLCKCFKASLSPHPRIVATQNELMNNLSKLVSCIGCKTSVERFYKQLVVANNSRRLNLMNLDKSIRKKFSYGGAGSALDPFIIRSNGDLTLKRSVLMDPQMVYKLFYLNCAKLDQIIDQISKCKKSSRRCNLHSLEFAQKQKLITDWLPVWDAFENDECRAKSLIIDTSHLMSTLDNYLRKHKFCGDCKMKVIRAFNILTGELDSSKEKAFCSSLYDGIECCNLTHDYTDKTNSNEDATSASITNNYNSSSNSSNASCTCSDASNDNSDSMSTLNDCCNAPNNQHYYHNHVHDGIFKNQNHLDKHSHDHDLCNNSSTTCFSPKQSKHNATTNILSKYKYHSNEQHLHLKPDKQFISSLIIRAEPEIQGNRRERHAKTLDIAQEEVLTCIGIHLFERFHRIHQAMKTEEQTWQLLFYASVFTLKKCFEVEFENIQGTTNIELLCAEFEALDESRQTRKRIKKERRKKNKSNNSNSKRVIEIESTNSQSDSLSSITVKKSNVKKAKSSMIKSTIILPAVAETQTKSNKKKETANFTNIDVKNKYATNYLNENVDSGNDLDAYEDEDEQYNEEEDDDDEMEDEDSSNEGEDEEVDEEEEDEEIDEYELDDVNNPKNAFISENKYNILKNVTKNSTNTSIDQSQLKKHSLNELDDLYDESILLSSGSSSCTASSSSSSCSTTSLEPKNNTNSSKAQTDVIKATLNTNLTSSSSSANSKTSSCSCFLFNQVYESYDLIQYYENDDNNNYNGDIALITDEEKNEYYANKSLYRNEIKNRREMLKEKFQNFKLNQNFKIRPRNVS